MCEAGRSVRSGFLLRVILREWTSGSLSYKWSTLTAMDLGFGNLCLAAATSSSAAGKAFSRETPLSQG